MRNTLKRDKTRDIIVICKHTPKSERKKKNPVFNIKIIRYFIYDRLYGGPSKGIVGSNGTENIIIFYKSFVSKKIITRFLFDKDGRIPSIFETLK